MLVSADEEKRNATFIKMMITITEAVIFQMQQCKIHFSMDYDTQNVHFSII